ncbi:MAG: arginine--tRNA ligase [Gemmatimonadota bacterium]|nr:arginine--tRNA ligase [Gemmatimonadota bacterium]
MQRSGGQVLTGADRLREALSATLTALGHAGTDIRLERPRDGSHGDLATAVALQLAKATGENPRALASKIVDALDVPPGVIEKTAIAGPGFINFWLADTALASVIERVVQQADRYGHSSAGAGTRVNVEFVSANPTGPLHVGHGRGAALGDAIAALLEATGHEVTREFYVNDAGLQIDRLGRSLWARVQQAVGRDAAIPEGGYHGAYLEELAADVLSQQGKKFADLPDDEGSIRCRDIAVLVQREEQDRDLADFGVRFDVVCREQDVYGDDSIAETLDALQQRALVYERDGALWLDTSRFGDAKDRVLRKSDGTYTYFLPDIAYHRTKLLRGFDVAIDVWGADHHGYVPRMRAALAALGAPAEFFDVVIVQLVRVMRHGEEVRFSKRAGEFVSLRDLYEETGVDAARYFFLMRRGDTQFVFDIDLATKQSEENPVYYVQYAHTRMAGIFRTAGVAPHAVVTAGTDLTALSEDSEQEIIKRLAEFPMIVEKAAEYLEPHRIIAYLEELAKLVNAWYHHHRVLGSGERVERARLVLARAAQIVIANGLALLGVSAPERM